MSYIGVEPATGYSSTSKQTITGTGVATYNLDYDVANESDIRVYVNNVHQEGGVGKAYTVSGNQITFSEDISSDDDCYVIYAAKAVQSVTPPDDSITTAMITDDAVTKAKLGTTEFDVATVKDSTGANTAMTITADGQVNKPNHPAFMVRGNTSAWKGGTVTGWYTFVGGTTVTNATGSSFADRGSLGMNLTESGLGAFDNNGDFNTTTGEFTAPIDGIYHFNLQLYVQKQGTSTSNFIHICPMINDSVVSYTIFGRQSLASELDVASCVYTAKLSANDTFSWVIYDGGSDFRFYGDHFKFSGFMIA